MVFKHPDRAEFKVVEFDPYNSGIPVIKTSRNPQDDSLMALSLSNVKELTDHVVGADTLSQIIDITSNLKTYKDNDDELNKILNSKFLSLLSVPMQATTVDANSLKILLRNFKVKQKSTQYVSN